ncbi:MAG TPA: polyphenol oxidase family protein [Acidimicrobiales bacterium]|nr:polyphenol oxidase family protein [Acidimicrobiales bacterium]
MPAPVNGALSAGPAVALAAEWRLAGGTRVACTGWSQGDMAGTGAASERRRKAVVDLPWTLLQQVHGARVVTVDHPGGGFGEPADAAVSAVAGAALAVLTADCAPVALASPEGLFGVAHAGWKGLRAGVIEATVQSLRRLGATRVEAVLGPCIHPCCYAFGDEELMEIEARLGRHLRAADRDGRPALDLPAGVRAALHAAGASLVGEATDCTGCAGGLWSWRTGRTERRQATVVWRP